MGDRRTAEIRTSEGSLYVYTHWGGAEFPALARDAIDAARPRWGDEPYAVHIIVDRLTLVGRDQKTGYGLLLKPTAEDEYNNNQPSIIIDLPSRHFAVMDRDHPDATRSEAF